MQQSRGGHTALTWQSHGSHMAVAHGSHMTVTHGSHTGVWGLGLAAWGGGDGAPDRIVSSHSLISATTPLLTSTYYNLLQLTTTYYNLLQLTTSPYYLLLLATTCYFYHLLLIYFLSASRPRGTSYR